MTSPNSTLNTCPFTGHFSPALLALKRFIRGTLRQAGIGAISLVIVLNLGTHSPALSAGVASESSSLASTYSATREDLSQPVQHLAQNNTSSNASLQKFSHRPSSQADSAVSSCPSHSIIARMTHHHLTSARLSLPTTSERLSVSVAGAR